MSILRASRIGSSSPVTTAQVRVWPAAHPGGAPCFREIIIGPTSGSDIDMDTDIIGANCGRAPV